MVSQQCGPKRAAGVTLGLPLLECMTPTFARAASATPPRRLLVIANNIGVLPKLFFPTTSGRDTNSPYDDHRELSKPGTPEVREYRLIGVLKDQESGTPSDATSVTFSG